MIYAAARIKGAVGKAAWERVRRRRLAAYLKSDRRPWREGYEEYKHHYVKETLANRSLLKIFRESSHLPESYGYWLDARVVEIPWALAHAQSGAGLFLDAGSALNHEYVLTWCRRMAPMGKH